MTASRDDLFRRLADLGIETRTIEHPPVYTVEEAKVHRGELTGGHCKNLFLKDKKGQLWLVVTLEDRAIDMKALRHRIGASHLSFGKPELLREVLGIEPGSVTPFAVINDEESRVNVVLDAEMMEMRPLNYHPLENTATTSIAPEDLKRFLEASGHPPAVVAL